MRPGVLYYNHKEKRKGDNKMNWDIFESIFESVMDELNISAWYELFDSDRFEIVEERIRECFGVEDEFEIDEYDDWYNTMVMDL